MPNTRHAPNRCPVARSGSKHGSLPSTRSHDATTPSALRTRHSASHLSSVMTGPRCVSASSMTRTTNASSPFTYWITSSRSALEKQASTRIRKEENMHGLRNSSVLMWLVVLSLPLLVSSEPTAQQTREIAHDRKITNGNAGLALTSRFVSPEEACAAFAVRVTMSRTASGVGYFFATGEQVVEFLEVEYDIQGAAPDG